MLIPALPSPNYLGATINLGPTTARPTGSPQSLRFGEAQAVPS